MGRPGASKRLKKAEKAKVQLKGYATKFLPKGKNVTDTTFKVRKIVLQDQIKTPDTNEVLTRRKLSIKDVLARLQHYSSTQRMDGLSGITELLSQMDKKQLSANLLSILDNLGKLSLDVESRVRRSAARVLTSLLAKVDECELSPFSAILGSYVSCAMTHIKPGVQEDSLLILDALLHYAPSLIALSASQLLSCSLDMISRLKDGKAANRQLSVNLSSSMTSSAWRASVLGRLQALLQISVNQLSKQDSNSKDIQTLYLNEDALKKTHLPLYNTLFSASPCLSGVFHQNKASKSYHQPLEDSTQLKNYTDSLMPLLLDSWLEVKPLAKKSNPSSVENELSGDAAIILFCVLEIMYLLWQHLNIWDKNNGCNDLTDWFKQTFTSDLKQYFTPGFPYIAQSNPESDPEDGDYNMKYGRVGNSSDNSGTSALFNIATLHGSEFKADSSTHNAVVKCMPQNLRLCYIFASVLKSPSKPLKDNILSYLTSCLYEWNASCAPWNGHLLLALETILKCSCLWSCDMNPLLSAVVERHKRSAHKKSQTHRLFAESLCKLLGSVALSTDFPALQQSKSLCTWLNELPASLNIMSITVEIVHLFCKLACRGNESFLQGIQAAVPSLLKLLQNVQQKNPEESCEMGVGLISLLYRIPHWSADNVQLLGEILLENRASFLFKKLANTLSTRRESCPQLKCALWWDQV